MKANIFIETEEVGSSEYNFFKYLLNHLKIGTDYFELKTIGGWEKIYNNTNINILKTNKAKNIDNLIILDADFKYENNNNGYLNRKAIISDKLKENDIDYKLFLMPNDKDDGKLETILEQMAINKEILKCIENYITCISKFDEELNKNEKLSNKYTPPNLKEKMFIYVDAHTTHNRRFNNNKKKNWFENCEHIWDLKHEVISPLTSFLISNLLIKNKNLI